MTNARRALVAIALLIPVRAALAGFAGNDLFIPASARADGSNSSHYYTSIWITNVQTASAVTVTLKLYALNGASNPAATATATLAAGETKRWDNVLQSVFGLSSGAGAIRLQATGDIVASSRTYNQPTGTSVDQSAGLFLGAVPASFAAGANESTMLQGVTQGSNENFRYNYGIVETTGQAVTARVVLRNESGAQIGSDDVALPANGAVQFNVGDQFPGVALTGGRLDVTVIGGSGKLLVYGTQITNVSNDSAGFEMVFRDGLLSDKSASTSENVAGSSSSNTVSAAEAAYKTGVTITAGPGSIAPLATIPPIYDPISGTWTVQVTLSTGQSGIAHIGFKDASGAQQKFYNALTTTTMTATGQAWGTQGNVTFDFVLGGVNASASSYVVNGSGSGSARGTTGTFTVTSVVIPKAVGSWPTSGTVSVQALGVTVTVTFNGTSTVTGTYTYLNQTRSFTVNLATGEVTRT